MSTKEAQTYTVGALARRFGLSRSTLLYYDSIGLLSPARRSPGGYRLYGPEHARALEAICTYRQAGLSLADIKLVLQGGEGGLAQALQARLEDINRQVEDLRGQQLFILGLLKNPKATSSIGVMDRDKWVELLRASGFSDEDMVRWHQAFERNSPQGHQTFLEFLRIPREEIKQIRAASGQALEEPA